MKKSMLRIFTSIVFAAVMASANAASLISGADDGPAIGGYDTVAYFTDGRPVKGKAEFNAEWNNANWLFASTEHRDLFLSDPEKYVPQYGGYCAYATAHGGVATGDGERWRIVDDKLYLNNNWFAHKLWQADVPGFIKNGDDKWTEVQTKIEAKH